MWEKKDRSCVWFHLEAYGVLRGHKALQHLCIRFLCFGRKLKTKNPQKLSNYNNHLTRNPPKQEPVGNVGLQVLIKVILTAQKIKQ